ncbi:MAG: hypothetical protein ACR2QF_01440, partial [Geminicoccaceae bacterium]
MAFNQASETPGLKQPDLSSTDPNSDGDVGLNLDDAVSEGVRLGYGVIEDQIRQAQRMASKLNPGNSGPAGASDEIGSLLNRLLQTYGDLNNGWIKVLNAAAGNPDLLKTILGNGQGGPNDLSGFRPDGQRPANGPLQNYGDIAKVWLEILSAASSNVDIINAIVGGSR